MSEQDQIQRTAANRPLFTYQDESALVSHLLGDLERKLAGRHERRVLRIIPSDHCHLGVLGPRDPHIQQPEPLDPAEENAREAQPSGRSAAEPGAAATDQASRTESAASTTAAAEETPDDSDTDAATSEQVTAEQQGATRDSTRRPPSSLGFEIVARPDEPGAVIELTLDVRFCVYTQHFPTFEEQREEVGRQPGGGSGGPQQVPNSSSVPPQPAVVAPRSNPATGAAQSGARGTVSIIEAFIRREVAVPPITVRIDPSQGNHRVTDRGIVQRTLNTVLDDAVADPSIWREISGTATVPAQALQTEQAFAQYLRSIATGSVLRPPLQAALDIRVHPTPDGLVRVQCYLCNETPRDIVHRFRDQHNILADCQVRGTLVRGNLVPVELLPVPRDYQFDRAVWAVGHGASVVVSDDRRAIRTEGLARYAQPRRTTSGEPQARFENLVNDPLVTLEAIRQAMIRYADDWQSRVIDQNTQLQPDELDQCRQDLAAFRDEEARLAAGLAALNRDPRLLEAFRGMNRVFQRTTSGRYDSWHLFQIVFIVTQMPALATRERFNDGEWPVGVRRNWEDVLDWADVLWFPTGGGKTEAYLGLISCAALYDRLRGKRFGVTAWLRFPLRMLSVQQLQRAAKVLWETEQERRQLLGADNGNSDPISLGYFVGKGSTPNQLRAEDGEWSFTRLENDPTLRDKLLLVSDCPACRRVGSVEIRLDRASQRIRHICSHCGADLPVYVSDDEVFRFLPTVIVGTIDKMASIAYQAKFAMLWGGAAWRCPEHPDHGYGLGDWCIDNCPGNPRRGTTARRRTSLSLYDPAPILHIQDELHLLQQELGAFAGHYETLVRSCEAAVGGRPPKTVAATATIEGFEHQIRHVYGVRHARRFPTRGFDVLETFYTTADKDRSQAHSPIKTARVYVAFRPPHLHAADAASLCVRLLHEELIRLYDNPYEAAAWLPTARTAEEVRALLFYYSTTLTYVGSKARGVRIRQALDREAGRLRPGAARDLTTEFLSGDSTLAAIAEMVRRIEDPPEWTEDSYLDATIATNVISHGVDVERFNLMVMDSVPEETADYIQASSRSGRRHVGLVLSVLASYSLRASSIYHRFTEYHQHLERLVSPVSVNRFAKYAATRTAPGIFVGLLLGRYGPLARNAQLGKRNVASELLTPDASTTLPFQVTRDQLRQAVEAAYALGQNTYPNGLELAMHEALEELTDRCLYAVRGSRQDKVVDVIQPKPMTSLRDVDAGVRFRPEEDASWEELRWFDSQGS